jgi:hypothetical protein
VNFIFGQERLATTERVITSQNTGIPRGADLMFGGAGLMFGGVSHVWWRGPCLVAWA